LRSRPQINGKTISRSNTTELNIAVGLDVLSKKGLASNDSTDLTTQANNLLGALNVTIETKKLRNFSLKDDQTDTEGIANSNLANQNLGSLIKQQVGALDKFPCSEGSFYNLDGAPDQVKEANDKELQRQLAPTSSIQAIAADIAGINLNNKDPSLTVGFKV
jgi:hypothetical protein